MAKQRKKEKKPPPACKAILLCDQVLVDMISQKVSLIGIFAVFFVSDFPGLMAPFHAFLQMTDGIGSYGVTVEIHDFENDVVLARANVAQIVFPDRATKKNLIIPVPPLPIPHEGEYDFVVLADGQEIDRQQFNAKKIPGGKNGANQS